MPEEGSPRRVSMQEAVEFITAKKNSALKVALGVMLCILSPICVILFSVMSEYKNRSNLIGKTVNVIENTFSVITIRLRLFPVN